MGCALLVLTMAQPQLHSIFRPRKAPTMLEQSQEEFGVGAARLGAGVGVEVHGGACGVGHAAVGGEGAKRPIAALREVGEVRVGVVVQPALGHALVHGRLHGEGGAPFS